MSNKYQTYKKEKRCIENLRNVRGVSWFRGEETKPKAESARKLLHSPDLVRVKGYCSEET